MSTAQPACTFAVPGDGYAQERFETEELSGYLKSMIEANKSVHEQVAYQPDTERTFVEHLEKNEAIKFHA